MSEIAQLAAALVKARADLHHVGKDKKVSIKTKSGATISYGYADLSDVIDVCTAALTPHGVTFLQPVIGSEAGTIRVRTTLLHESGESLSDEGVPIAADFRDAKSVGSAVTYARRYGLASMVGIAQTDDDGKAARKAKTSAPPVKVDKNLAREEDKAKMRVRVDKLTDEHKGNIREYMRANNIEGASMTIKQLALVAEAIDMAEAS